MSVRWSMDEDLERLCASAPELERLLERIRTLLPIVQQQRREANAAAELAYFSQPDVDAEAVRLWEQARIMSAATLIAIAYPRPSSAEYRELYAIGLAVAAFGGADAISAIGWEAGQGVWHIWDGMAGHVL